MKLQQLYSYVRQAIDDYQMIADGDRIAVGISGGKEEIPDVQTGIFGADMKISLINDGPFTILLDSEDLA